MTNTSAYSLFIEWEPPYTPNGIIVNYTIYLDYNNETTDLRITDFNANEYLLEGLSPHQLVGVEMTANTSIGEGPRSPIQEIRTHQAGNCDSNGIRSSQKCGIHNYMSIAFSDETFITCKS